MYYFKTDGKIPSIVLDYPRKCIYYGHCHIKFICTEDRNGDFVLNKTYEATDISNGGFFNVEENNGQITLK